MGRVILHCDLNNFFASVECLYNPDLRDKPVAVCGSQAKRHGIVLAKNEIAKRYGVRTAETIWQARQKCPGLVIVGPDYGRYLSFSKAARTIYEEYTDLVEPFGIDESWLDVTESVRLFGGGEKIAHEIRQRIHGELGITASVGVSYNKIFAKLGSDMKKPNAVTVISEENFRTRVWNLPAHELLYVGPATRKKLVNVGIYTIGDIANANPRFLVNHLGKWGETLWTFANGFDCAPVTRSTCESAIKSVGNSVTCSRDLICNEDVKALMYALADSVGSRLRKYGLQGRSVQITLRDSGLQFVERQAAMKTYTCVSSEIASRAYDIFLQSWNWSSDVRLVGVRVMDLAAGDKYIQMSMFFDDRCHKRELLDYCVDTIRTRFGHHSIQRALLLGDDSFKVNPKDEHVAFPVPYFK